MANRRYVPVDQMFLLTGHTWESRETRSRLLRERYDVHVDPAQLPIGRSETFNGIQHRADEYDTSVFIEGLTKAA